jgi:hypothetical protein
VTPHPEQTSLPRPWQFVSIASAVTTIRQRARAAGADRWSSGQACWDWPRVVLRSIDKTNIRCADLSIVTTTSACACGTVIASSNATDIVAAATVKERMIKEPLTIKIMERLRIGCEP